MCTLNRFVCRNIPLIPLSHSIAKLLYSYPVSKYSAFVKVQGIAKRCLSLHVKREIFPTHS